MKNFISEDDIEKIFSEQKRRKCYPPEYTIDNEAKEVSVKVYARDYTDAKSSFMTSEKDVKRHNSVIKEPYMTSEKDAKRHNNVKKEISATQDLIILAMRKEPNITIAELADLVRISTSNVSRNIQKLQELGLLERVGGRKNGKWIVQN